jgi:threonyl-tRNA synthetase
VPAKGISVIVDGLAGEKMEKDHRRLGKELGIFHISSQVGVGLPLWLPNGVVLRQILVDYLEKQQSRCGYQKVVTPHIGRLDLYETSGHWQAFRESMYQPITIDKDKFILKPMNCPHHIEIYKAEPRSYRDLPVRLSEFGTVYRYEQTGELLGLMRTRGFTIDDAHIFCAEDQLGQEFESVIELIKKVIDRFDFKEFKLRIGLRDRKEKYIGSDSLWQKSEETIRKVLKGSGLKFSQEKGEAAFYGPKLDFLIKDSWGREWQLGTIQVDYNLAERFKLEYTGKDGKKQKPMMIHRAILGSLERFIAILLEHCKGRLPVWLAPVQAMIIPVSEKFSPASQELAQELEGAIRVQVDDRQETVSKRVLKAKQRYIPYILVYGEEETKSGKLAVLDRQDKRISLTAEELIEKIEKN